MKICPLIWTFLEEGQMHVCHILQKGFDKVYAEFPQSFFAPLAFSMPLHLYILCIYNVCINQIKNLKFCGKWCRTLNIESERSKLQSCNFTNVIPRFRKCCWNFWNIKFRGTFFVLERKYEIYEQEDSHDCWLIHICNCLLLLRVSLVADLAVAIFAWCQEPRINRTHIGMLYYRLQIPLCQPCIESDVMFRFVTDVGTNKVNLKI